MILDIFHSQEKLRILWHVFEYSSRKCSGKISSNLNDENRHRKNWLEKKVVLIPKTYLY